MGQPFLSRPSVSDESFDDIKEVGPKSYNKIMEMRSIMRVGINKFFEFINKWRLHLEVRYLLSIVLVLFLSGCKTEKKTPITVTSPSLSSSAVSPSSGDIAGGTLITISGSNLDMVSAITIGTQPCTIVSAAPTQVTCRTSPSAAGVYDVTIVNQNRQITTIPGAYSYQTAPTITSVSPSSGIITGATPVTISGAGFSPGAIVSFGGSACAPVTVVSPTIITCTTSSHTAGAVNVVVTNTNAQSGTGVSVFTYRGAPTVTGISPIVGPLAGGAVVTITGSGFYTGSSVTLGGLACTGVNVVSSTSITCTTPAQVAGAVGITVTNADTQSGSLAAAYTYQAAPTVVSVTPNQGALGGGTSVTISGTNFAVGATASFGGSACTSLLVLNATTITCVTPMQLITGPVTVTVTNPDNQFGTLPNGYTYYLAPTVSSVSPNAGIITGGTAITITGSGFRAGATVDISGAACTPVTVVSPTSITCTTAAHIAGVGNVSVTNTDLQTGILYSGYTYRGAPTVTSVMPSAGATAGGTVVTVAGTGFYTGASVTFGGLACTGVNVVSATALTCTTPANPAGAVTVTVTNADTQTGNKPTAFTYQAAPTVASISLNAGALAGGTTVTISGTGFLAGAAVDFGGSVCNAVTVVNPTTITCTTSAHLAGAVTVKVTNTDSQFGSLGAAYTYQSAPSITSVYLTAIPALNPAAGSISGGSSLTITGTNFLTGATVSVGGSACTPVTVVNSTTITCTTTAHIAGTVNVVVTNLDTQTTTKNNGFTYQPAPSVTSVALQAAPTVTPATGAVAGGTPVTITGTGFVTGSTVTFGGAACTNVIFLSSTSITCKTPASPLVAPGTGAVAVVVTNADSQSGSLSSASPNTFAYKLAPIITSVTVPPLTVVAGPIAGGTTVNINGSNFDTTASVTIGGITCTTMTATATLITCTTGAHPAGLVDVVLTNIDLQSATVTNGFAYQNTPTVTGVNLNAGALAGGTNVTVTGTGFVTGAIVNFGTAPCTAVTVVNPSVITCTTPPAPGGGTTAGPVNVTVINTDTQSGFMNNAYTYEPAPVISGVTLQSVPALNPATGPLAGGTVINIAGSNFINAPVNPTVKVGTYNCTVTAAAAGAITCTIQAISPAAAQGPVNVVVTNPDGQASNAGTYVFKVAPNITSVKLTAHPTITPTTGALLGGTSIDIAGSGFDSVAPLAVTVKVGAYNCNVTASSATAITCAIQAIAAPGAAVNSNVNVVVTNSDLQSNIAVGAYTFVSAPSIAATNGITVPGITISAGATSGNTTIQIHGNDFLTGASATVGGIPCAISSVTSTLITCVTGAYGGVVPANVTAIVTNPDGQSSPAGGSYTYQDGPIISSLSVTSGSTTGGTAVTITGSGFLVAPAPAPTISFGGSLCGSVNVVNGSTITCTTIGHASGWVNLTITNPDTQASGTGAIPGMYLYLYDPQVNSVTVNAVPALTPAAGPIGGLTNVTIHGNYFLPGATVYFDPAAGTTYPCTGVNVVDQNTIKCATTAHAAGPVTVRVKNTNTQFGDSATPIYTYQPAPSVASVTQTDATPNMTPGAGAMLGGNHVKITGSNFVDSFPAPTVSVGGSACTSVSFVDSSHITCITPAAPGGIAGPVGVSVTNGDLQVSNTLNNAYTYQPAPTTSTVTPNAGALAGLTSVTIVGTNFIAGAEVYFGTVTPANACITPVVIDSTHITCTTPSHVAGIVTVTVRNPDWQLASPASATYTYQGPPVINTIDLPAAGNPAGGNAVKINGSNFLTGVGATVKFGTVAATCNYTSAPGSITCTAPAHAAGTVAITVVNPDGQFHSLANAYTYQNAPNITSVKLVSIPTLSPAAGSINGGTNIRIDGSGFLAGATVDFGGAACGSIAIGTGGTSLTCTTTAHAAGTVNVVVTNADTQPSNAGSYVYQDAPVITNVSPVSGPAAGGTSVNIAGTGFIRTPAPTVDFGGHPCTVTNINPFSGTPTDIQCTTSANPAGGVVSITVTNADGQTNSIKPIFTYYPAPTVTSISPNVGPLAGGQHVTIIGTGFVTTPSVAIGGVGCNVTSFTSTSITCITGTRAAGSGLNVIVTIPGPQSSPASATYTYQSMSLLEWQVGSASPNPPNPDSYGSTTVNVTHTYTLKNIGDVTTTAVSVSLVGGNSTAWMVGSDNCSGFTLAPAATCTVQETFMAGVPLPTGTYSTTLRATATTGGTTNNTMNGSVP